MEDFKDIQNKLQQAKRDREMAWKAAFLSKERLNKLGRKKAKLIRGQDQDSDALNAIRSEEEKLKKTLLSQNRHLLEQLNVEAGLLTAFIPFTDPQEHIQQFSDDIPLLLLPVRIETRFKRIISRAGAIQHQLWVRVFPDECSIHTFEDTPTESEVKEVRNYWSMIWEAGQSTEENLITLIKNKKKAAWKNLAGSFQAGRAYWLTENYQPVNLNELPDRTSKTDIILTIPVEDMPSSAEAIITYWKAYWEAAGSDSLITAAFDTFVNMVGSEEIANQLLLEYKPTNLATAKMPTIKVWFVASNQIDSVRSAAESEVILKIILGGWTNSSS